MINSGLGFQLAKTNVVIPKSSYVRSYVLLGVFVSLWFGLVVFDAVRARRRTGTAVVGGEGGEKGGVMKEGSQGDDVAAGGEGREMLSRDGVPSS